MVHEMVVAGVVWEVGDWLIKVPGRVLKFIQLESERNLFNPEPEQ